jgi:AcrR family transcriptional regulator
VAARRTRSKTALSELTRHHIQDAAIRALTRVGVQGLTMDRIAEEAGIAKGTIYLHFRTKRELVQQTIDAFLAPLVDELTTVLSSDLPADQRLRLFTQRHLAYFEDRHDLFRVLLHERNRLQIRADRRRNSLYKKLVEKTAETVERGIESGVFRNVDATKLAGLIIDANITVISQRLLEDHQGGADEDAEFLSSVIMDGIRRSHRQGVSP